MHAKVAYEPDFDLDKTKVGRCRKNGRTGLSGEEDNFVCCIKELRLDRKSTQTIGRQVVKIIIATTTVSSYVSKQTKRSFPTLNNQFNNSTTTTLYHVKVSLYEKNR